MGLDTTIEAVRSVFGTAELLEQILLQVDMKTLLLSQRVNSQWRDTITDSPALQKKLFFKPATFREVKELSRPDHRRGRMFIALTPDFSVPKITQPTQPTAMINPLLFRGTTLRPVEVGLEGGAVGESASSAKMLYIQPPPLTVAPALHLAVLTAKEEEEGGNWGERHIEGYVHFTLESRWKLDTFGELLNAIDQKVAVRRHSVDWRRTVFELHRVEYV